MPTKISFAHEPLLGVIILSDWTWYEGKQTKGTTEKSSLMIVCSAMFTMLLRVLPSLLSFLILRCEAH